MADVLQLKRPDLILVTSMMTYWYPGVRETVACLRECFPAVPIVLGGPYATLYQQHAKDVIDVDQVFSGQAEREILNLAYDFTGFSVEPIFSYDDIDAYPYPAFYLQRKIAYVPILSSAGCPYSCSYCASSFLNPNLVRRTPQKVVEEIVFWHKQFNVRNFPIYDDAFLVNAEEHAVPILEGVIRSGIRVKFHTPNALHIREIRKDIAALMYKAGFKTIRLGLETALFHQRDRLDKKVTRNEFLRSVENLKVAGFEKKQVGAYLLAGLPGQTMEMLEESIKLVKQTGISAIPAYYTPIPHTDMWEEAVNSSRYDMVSDPIFTNNALIPCSKNEFSWRMISSLKSLSHA